MGSQGGRVSTQSQITVCALCGAVLGAAAGYLFFTPAGRALRDRIEPAMDDLKRDFARFQGTIEKVGLLANDGLRMVNEFNNARTQGIHSSSTSH
jgi:gas vesicle protein